MSQFKSIRIATRQSELALWQAHEVARHLRDIYPALVVELLPMSTRGDQILDQPLAQIGGKGLFLKELEVALMKGEADLAVHSLKDVPMQLEPGFVLPVVLARANPFDAFVSNRYIHFDALPVGAVVGTSSLRRQAQLKAVRPDLLVRDLRGNVNTRLSKLDAGQFDAIILACAGLERLGFHSRIRHALQPPVWLPAVGQGAIGIECREDQSELVALLKPLNDEQTHQCALAERAMNRCLQGSCDVPIAGYAQHQGSGLVLEGMVGNAQTGELIRAVRNGDGEHPLHLGEQVAAELIRLGAHKMLQR
jgi:hydroxymethylbilane synthase